MRKMVYFFLPMITACSYQTTQVDGLPEAPKPVSHVKNAVPKKEPLSRYGNPAQYKVKGQTYHVLKTAKNYEEQGIASWYGTKFHNKRTSSGETYDMYQMTAAHKTLPLPSYVEVTNLDNDRRIVVKVNDRGPFHSDRIIDLSYAAAKKLGIISKGTGHVTLKTINLDSNTPLKNHYYLQVGAFSQSRNAENIIEKLERTVTPYSINLEEQNNTYLVQVGPIENLQSSQTLKSKLQIKGYTQVFSLIK